MGILDKFTGKTDEPVLDRKSQLEVELGASTAAVQAAVEDLELAHMQFAEGGEDRIEAAEQMLRQVEQGKDRCRRALDAYLRVADRKAVEGVQKARADAWKRAEQLASDRVVEAQALIEHLQRAGEIYTGLIESGYKVHQIIPAKPHGAPPSNYQLSETPLEHGVNVNLARAGLPGAMSATSSLLSGYADVVKVVEGALSCVRSARHIDESAA